jgi:transketolase C-terminal domain/subunit
VELPQILEWFVTSVVDRPLYLRLHRTPAPRAPGLAARPFRIGHGVHARELGGRLAVVTSGPHLTSFCCQAADALLAEDGEPVDVVTLTTLRPIDPTYARALAARYERLAVVEEAFETGGLLDELTHAFAAGIADDPTVRPPELLHLAVDDFAFSTREPLGLYQHFGLHPEGIRRFLRRAATRR